MVDCPRTQMTCLSKATSKLVIPMPLPQVTALLKTPQQEIRCVLMKEPRESRGTQAKTIITALIRIRRANQTNIWIRTGTQFQEEANHPICSRAIDFLMNAYW